MQEFVLYIGKYHLPYRDVYCIDKQHIHDQVTYVVITALVSSSHPIPEPVSFTCAMRNVCH